MFSFLQKPTNNDRFEVKLMTMNFISRMIGIHKLILLNFYTYLIRYIQPHQRDVTMVLVIIAQASHGLIPPDVLEPVIKAITNNFVSDHCSNGVMAAGLNAIREICVRQPLAIDATLLQDLTEYRSDRDKSVMMAARSLIGLFREINPELLKRKDRIIADKVEGIELLEEYKQKMQEVENGWEILSNSTSEDDDEGWIDVSSDEDHDILLTPADFAKLNELKMEHKAELMVNGSKQEHSDIVNVNTIIGPRKKAKQDYEERLESIKAGREGREKFGHKSKKVEGTSTTNREKKKRKAFMMVVHKNVLKKKKMSLRDKQIRLTKGTKGNKKRSKR
ncbi:9886_t:CDS:2 [Diversispora eburnea]|uniref:Protein SDA1 n=2 Tax=Diversisporales TaxID=214509 RepID=A0A9N9FIH8_9GLOM|nr:9886_t:CDS:2 [Diversispora eburnea]